MMKKIDIISNCFECSWFIRKRQFCGKSQRPCEWENDEHTGFPLWCELKEYRGHVAKTEPIFYGDSSREFWDMINATKDEDLWDLLYYLGCKLQELEHRVEKAH